MYARRAIFVLGMLTFFVAATVMAGSAKGTFKANGKSFNLKYAYAAAKKNPLVVPALSRAPATCRSGR